MDDLKGFLAALTDKKLTPTAIKVALVVGSILFLINHGTAFSQGKMTKQRWFAALITYSVPYCVNIHGQYTSGKRQLKRENSSINESETTLIK